MEKSRTCHERVSEQARIELHIGIQGKNILEMYSQSMIHIIQRVVWPKVVKSLETRNESSEPICVFELAKSAYEEWLRNMASGDMESRPSSTKFRFPKEARSVYAFLMAQVRKYCLVGE